MAFLATGAQLDQYPHLKTSMFKMRKRIFHDELGWDVTCYDDMERDRYDRPDTVYVLYLKGDDVVATWRMLPTTQDYMLADIWPEYADGYIPRRPDCWELSRWALDFERLGSKAAFEPVAVNMFCTLAEYCILNGIEEVIMLQDPKITPFSNQVFGLPHIRTAPKSAGKSDAHVVSFRPAFRQQLRQATELFKLQRPVTQVFDIGEMASMQIAAE